jgi:hypothetical protein
MTLTLAGNGAFSETARASDTPPSGLQCGPELHELQTRRPLPIECHADAEAVRLTLRYRERGTEQWNTLEMERHAGAFRAQVPCDVSMNAGNIDVFVVAQDSEGAPVDTLGSKSQPVPFTVDPKSSAAPAYPGESPPARCAEVVHCPPDFPGCADATNEGDVDEPRRTPSHAHWFGLQLAADVGFIGGSNVCTSADRDFDCYTAGAHSPYPAALPASVAASAGEPGDPYPGTGIGTGAALGTWRLLVSYEHPLIEQVSIGARLGYAWGGAPTSAGAKSFLPIHAEGRLSYWLRGLSADGVRPYLHLGGGFAQVDVHKSGVTVRDCSEVPERLAFLDCISAKNAYDSANRPDLPTKKLDAYRKLGHAFVTVGGGALFGLGGETALQLNLNAMLLLPATGFVLEPSVGLVHGF